MSDHRFTEQLESLRKRLMIAGGAWLVAFFICYGFAGQLFAWISQPLQTALPAGSKLVFFTATEPFFTYLKVAALVALIVALPVVFWQLWGLVAPLLKREERRLGPPFVTVSCLFFGIGAYFGFTLIFPTIVAVLVRFGTASGSVQAALSMESYLSLALHLLFAFGLVCELPVLIVLLARLGLVDHLWLRKNRKYMLIVAFVFGAVFTPGPDVFSQVSLALPAVALYEVGILGAKWFGRKPAVRAAPAPAVSD